jgi:hypothetical protein
MKNISKSIFVGGSADSMAARLLHYSWPKLGLKSIVAFRGRWRFA